MYIGRISTSPLFEADAIVADAVQLLRKTLAGEKDGAVTLIQVGFSTNLARLMEFAPDRYDDLSRMDLVKKVPSAHRDGRDCRRQA